MVYHHYQKQAFDVKMKIMPQFIDGIYKNDNGITI